MQGLKDNQSVLLKLEFLFYGGKGCEQQQQQQQQQKQQIMHVMMNKCLVQYTPATPWG